MITYLKVTKKFTKIMSENTEILLSLFYVSLENSMFNGNKLLDMCRVRNAIQ